MHGWKLNEFYVHMRWCRQCQCVCERENGRYSEANSITLIYSKMQILHFCLSKYLYKFFNGVCVCTMYVYVYAYVCVHNVYGFRFRQFSNFGRFGDLVFHSFDIYTYISMVDQSVFHSAWIICVGQAVNYDFSITTHHHCLWTSIPYINERQREWEKNTHFHLPFFLPNLHIYDLPVVESYKNKWKLYTTDNNNIWIHRTDKWKQ